MSITDFGHIFFNWSQAICYLGVCKAQTGLALKNIERDRVPTFFTIAKNSYSVAPTIQGANSLSP